MGRINIQDKNYKPTMDEINDYIGNPLFNDLITHIEKEYGTKPEIAYSGCSMQPGWNIKYKKSRRALCTLSHGRFFLCTVGRRRKGKG